MMREINEDLIHTFSPFPRRPLSPETIFLHTYTFLSKGPLLFLSCHPKSHPNLQLPVPISSLWL